MKFNRRNFLASSATLAMGASLGLQARDPKHTGSLPVNADPLPWKAKKYFTPMVDGTVMNPKNVLNYLPPG